MKKKRFFSKKKLIYISIVSFTEGRLEWELLILGFFVEVELMRSLEADEVRGIFSLDSLEDDVRGFVVDFFERRDF